jgi:hypothetical protein
VLHVALDGAAVLGFFNATGAKTPWRQDQTERFLYPPLGVIRSIVGLAVTLRKNSPLILASWRLGDLGVKKAQHHPAAKHHAQP